MRARDLARMLRRPTLLAHQIRQWIYEARNPGHPWWAPSAIQLLERTLTRQMTGLEWGSGRSTVWLAERVATMTSIEHVPGWHAKVQGMLDERSLGNVSLELIEVPGNPEAFGAAFWEDNAYATAVERFADGSLDVVVVDGAYRMPCAWRALPKIAPGGLLLIDDALHAGSLEAWRIPADWTLLHGTGPGVWSTTIWRKPS